ncbi:MAG: LacI family DNA-binding transcriptional regulator [Armatimonadota bacterium]|nr:LacI family transcriptional regulator [bacterium]
MAKANGRPTSQDVAREAGVSQCTVSYVLSGGKNKDRISPETTRRVLAAAARLGYSRNSIGAALRRGYSDTIVLLAVTWELAASHSHTTISVSRAAAERGMTTIVHVASDDKEAIAFLGRVPSLNPYGLLLLWDSNAIPEADRLRVELAGLPVVDLMPRESKNIASVTADRAQGSYIATRHLIEMGHQHIGMILDTSSRAKTSLKKLDGYRVALDEAGIPFHESLLQEVTSFGFEGGYDGFHKLLRRRPDATAVMCINDHIALGALASAQNLGLSVPGDISVVGFGAHPEGTFLRPSLTTLAIPAGKIADDAINLLMKLREDESFVPEPLREPMELIVRESTGPARLEALSTKSELR